MHVTALGKRAFNCLCFIVVPANHRKLALETCIKWRQVGGPGCGGGIGHKMVELWKSPVDYNSSFNREMVEGMKQLYTRVAMNVGCVAMALALAACATGSKMFDKTVGADQNAPPPPPPGAAGPAPIVATAAAPSAYSMTAQCVGPCINFSLTNTSPAEIVVNPEHFALIPSGTRRVVPYDSQSATIDVPATVPAGGTVTGRAVFKEFSSPSGHKLVYKPDATGTYAVVGGPGGSRASASAAN
jgi:hypothetical protein